MYLMTRIILKYMILNIVKMKTDILQLEEWEIYYLLCLPKEEIIFV